MSRLMQDGTARPVSRDQIRRRERYNRLIHTLLEAMIIDKHRSADVVVQE